MRLMRGFRAPRARLDLNPVERHSVARTSFLCTIVNALAHKGPHREAPAMPDSPRVSIDTGTDELLAERDGDVAIITLNRPQARNSLSDTLSPALRDLLPKLATDHAARDTIRMYRRYRGDGDPTHFA